ncbi:MAG: hypothetical protein COB98_02590 [Flavobacteriaceae bacterium]|nr:MAG: hypothetical protein COB98_02590 [Flavobacteriaceae bacterium]
MHKNEILKELLRKKGIGPSGSKHLDLSQTMLLRELLFDSSLEVITQATMLTALLTLEANSEEATLIAHIKEQRLQLPKELQNLLFPTEYEDFVRIIRQVIAGNDLSKKEAYEGVSYLFKEEIPDYLKAVFLEAERLKRETFQENLVFLNSFWEHSTRQNTEIPVLIDICNNYDGWQRIQNYSVFVAQLLAIMGFPTVLHGAVCVAPKFGFTNYTLLKTMGYPSDNSLSEAVAHLNTSGWAYVNNTEFSPEINGFNLIREHMVKRPFIATFEKILHPIHAVDTTYGIVGYTHKKYKMTMSKLVLAHAKTIKSLVIKGEEGSPQLSLDKPTEYALIQDGLIIEKIISPKELGILVPEKPKLDPPTANSIMNTVQQAMEGKNDYVRNKIIYNAMAYCVMLGFEMPRLQEFEAGFDQIPSFTNKG